MNNQIIKNLVDRILKSKLVRAAITGRSHWWFIHIYLSHYITCEMAPFHREMLQITKDTSIRTAVVMAFRGSAKSTIFSLSYPLWAILGEQQLKYIIIVSQTQYKAQQLLGHIKRELENNKLLQNDLGPFQTEGSGPWNITSIYIPKYNAKITAASIEQGIRSFRHNQYRPQLIVCDDIEDQESVKMRESRDKTFQQVTRDIIPAGDTDTRLIMVGNLLHEDSTLMKLLEAIQEGQMDGVSLRYPLIDDEGKIAWPGKFPNMEAVEAERKRIGNESAWQQEYLLHIVVDEHRIILPGWIKEYEKMPSFESPDYVGTYIGIDPAVSEDEYADCTAMVAVSVFGRGDRQAMYVHPNPVNERMSFHAIKERAIFLARTIAPPSSVIVVVEDVAAQRWLIDELTRAGIRAEPFKVHGMDKGARLKVASVPVEAGKVFFPKYGGDAMRSQVLNFGTERYDDLADAFSMALGKITDMETAEPAILTVMREEVERMKKNPNSPGNLTGWKRLADDQRFFDES